MFSKKLHADVKKSTQKIQDLKKDSATRFKHLRIVLENVDSDEAKSFFEVNYSHIYYILYDNFIAAETNLKQKVHKAHREELEAVLLMLDKVLILCPELLSKRWQCHSLTRLITKLLHPGNSWKLRREAVRYFLLWYQALGDNSPDSLHAIFATLVPGFLSPIPGHTGLTGLNNQPSATVFHDFHHGPVSPAEIQPVFLPQSGEKQPDDPVRFFLDALLEFMVTQVPRIEWRDKTYKQYRSFMFLFERFKQYYLPYIFPTFCQATSLYKPNLDLAQLQIRYQSEERKKLEQYINCRVAFIKWIANFTHSTKIKEQVVHFARSASVTPSESEGERSPGSELRRVSVGTGISTVGGVATVGGLDDSAAMSPFVSTQDHTLSEDPNVTAFNLVREILYGTRDNVNLVHEVYRQAFLLSFTYSPAIRRAITVYKDWIQMNVPELPPFMLEPLENRSSGPSSSDYNSFESPSSSEENTKGSRLRNDSYIGAISKENIPIRAGLQNVLQVFITHAANVFLLEVSPEYPLLLEEQVDTCKRVLNIYRYMVMHTNMEARTWEQLLLVLLRITSLILSKTPPKRKEETLGGKLAPAIFQTLIVTWIKANLNVVISSELWDQFLTVLSSLTQWEELIREWAKTLETLTRVLARHVYSLDLTDLPLDRLSEQKAKRQRRSGPVRTIMGNEVCRESNESAAENKLPSDTNVESTVMLKTCESWPPLRRTASESNINWTKHRRRHQHQHHSNTADIPASPIAVEQEAGRMSGTREQHMPAHSILLRKSKSLDSLRYMKGGWISSYCDSEGPTRSPSPAPSSGVESNSFKESPMQIDVLNAEGTSIDVLEGERKSVMSGGTVRGWLPDVAVVLWRRMLGALGDINSLQDPLLHAQVFQYLVELMDTMTKIRQNQGVPGDNQATPVPPELVPPTTIIAPWCFQALNLPDSYSRGKLYAYRLLCHMMINSRDVPFPPGLLPQFYRVLHQGLISTDQNIVNTLVRFCGPRFFSLQLPGFTLLLLDFIHAANSVVSSHDVRTTPRTEAMSILGILLNFPKSISCLLVLQPTLKEFIARATPDAKEHVIKMLLCSGKTECAGVARCIALSSLGLFVYQEMAQASIIPPSSTHPKIKEAINTLLLALRFNHKTVAQVSSDILLLLCDHAQVLLRYFPEIPPRIVEVLAGTLAHMMPVGDSDKRLLTSLVFCLGEWTMRLPSNILLAKRNNTCLLQSIFKVLTDLAEGSKLKSSAPVGGSFHPDLVQEFNPNILLDNLKQDDSSPAVSRRITGNSPPHLNSPAHSIQLAAKMVVLHLLNHLGHFPLAIGAARLCSLVVEHDDVPGLTSDQLSAEVFSAANIQLFIMSSNLLMSLVELPTLEVPGGGVTAGLVTAPSQVRLILRDLAGKASWDASILYCTPEQFKQSESMAEFDGLLADNKTEEALLNSCIVGNIPQHTLRHRPPHMLPTYENSAEDLDNLDDLLQYIGETSPECLENLDTPRNIPTPALNYELEQEAMSSVLGQRYLEQDHINRSATHSTMQVENAKRVKRGPSVSPFQHCRLLFSQLALAGWERRSQLQLLDKNEKLLRELRNLDTQRCRETHKIAVIYVAEGQEDKNSILSNTGGSQAYEDFIAGLAWEVELESHTGFMGGLQRNKTTGSTAPYYATSFTEAIFHVSTRMPSSSHEALLQKTRHLGNDEVHIVWSEHSRDYRRGIIPTEFCDILIVIYPLPHKLFRIQISRKPEVPYFGPLYNEAVVEQHVLAGLVRATAISASRAKRSMLPFYQQYYEERARSLETIMKNHKNATTFEEFASQVFSPLQTPSPFYQGPTRASGISCRSMEGTACLQVTPSSTLAAALIDSHTTPSSHSMRRPRLNTDASRLRVGAEGSRVWFVSSSEGESNSHGISPRPLKKLVLKSGPKRVAPPTPPDSPTSRRSK